MTKFPEIIRKDEQRAYNAVHEQRVEAVKYLDLFSTLPPRTRRQRLYAWWATHWLWDGFMLRRRLRDAWDAFRYGRD